MAPQSSIPAAANVLGTAGTVCWCIQLIPQIIHNYKRKNTAGLPWVMMLTWSFGAVPMGAYLIIQNANIPVQVQSQIFCLLTLITWAQVMIYSHNWVVWRAMIVAIVLGAVFGGIETVLVFTIRIPYHRGIGWPVVFLGVVAAIFLVIGGIFPYIELGKRRGRVIGINFLFLFIDWLGAVLSFLAIAVQHSFDILASTLYIVVIVLEAGIIISHLIWMFRFRKLRKEAKLTGKTIEEVSDEPMERKLAAIASLKIHLRLLRRPSSRPSAARQTTEDLEKQSIPDRSSTPSTQATLIAGSSAYQTPDIEKRPGYERQDTPSTLDVKGK